MGFFEKWEWARTVLYTFFQKRRFARFGKGSLIVPSAILKNCENVSVGEQVGIGPYCWIQTVTEYADEQYMPEIRIGNRTTIGAFSIISGSRRIEIGNDVLIAPRVFITDSIHGYEDVSLSINVQPLKSKAAVYIGDGAWLGINSVILPGVRIGENAVVAAGSVVTKNVPPFSVAAGIPAKVIRKYDFKKKKWTDVDYSAGASKLF